MSKTTYFADNEQWDCTDLAHPAWWRGNDHGFASCVSQCHRILDNLNINPGGISNMPEWDRLRVRLQQLNKGQNL